MKVLVTGGGGFLGRHIVDKLLSSGNTDIRVLSRGSYPDLTECGIEVIKADLSDKDKLINACEGVESIFHVASKTGISGRFKDYHQTNVIGTRNLLQAAGLRGVKNFIYTSTPSVVYGKDEIINGKEDLPYPNHYLTYYAATKAEAEIMVLSYNGRAGLRTCSLRPHLIFGPGDTNLTPRIIEKSLSGKLRIVGSASNLVSVSYVENVADAHICALERLKEKDKNVCGEAFFINEDKPVNCWEFINNLLESCGAPIVDQKVSSRTAYVIGAFLERLGSLFSSNWEPPMTRFLALQLSTSHYFDNTKAKTLLKWSPQVSISESLKQIGFEYSRGNIKTTSNNISNRHK